MSHHFLRYCIAIALLFISVTAFNFANSVDRDIALNQYYSSRGNEEFDVTPLHDRAEEDVVIPQIISLSTTTLRVGDTLTVNGRAFSGFESDKIVQLKNIENGKEIPVLGSTASTDTAIIFTLEKSYCSVDTSYSGLPCPSYVDIIPGTYSLYASAWGATSSPVQLKIVEK